MQKYCEQCVLHLYLVNLWSSCILTFLCVTRPTILNLNTDCSPSLLLILALFLPLLSTCSEEDLRRGTDEKLWSWPWCFLSDTEERLPILHRNAWCSLHNFHVSICFGEPQYFFSMKTALFFNTWESEPARVLSTERIPSSSVSAVLMTLNKMPTFFDWQWKSPQKWHLYML